MVLDNAIAYRRFRQRFRLLSVASWQVQSRSTIYLDFAFLVHDDNQLRFGLLPTPVYSIGDIVEQCQFLGKDKISPTAYM